LIGGNLVNMGAVFLYMVVAVAVVRRQPLLAVAFLYMFLGHVKDIMSCFYLDTGNIYMMEIDRYSNTSYATTALVAFYVVGIALSSLLYRGLQSHMLAPEYDERFRTFTMRWHEWIITGCIGVAFLLIFHVAMSGSPLWNAKINKTNFWVVAARIPQLAPLASQTPLMCMVMGMIECGCKDRILTLSRPWRVAILGFPILMILHQILMGHRFGGLVIMIYTFLTPFAVRAARTKTLNLSKLAVGILLVGMLLTGVVYAKFSMKYGQDAINKISERVFALQAQVWHSLYNDVQNGYLQTSTDFFTEEVAGSVGFRDGIAMTGMERSMRLLMPKLRYDFYKTIKINLSGVYPGVLFLYFSNIWKSLIFHAVLAGVYALLGMMMIGAINRLDLFGAFLWTKLFLAFGVYMGQAYTGDLLSPENALFAFLLAFLFLMRRLSSDSVQPSPGEVGKQ